MATAEAVIPPVFAGTLQAPRYRFSPEEYLAFERNSNERHHYFDGEIVAMVGASRAHNLISGNLIRELGAQLKDRPCEVYPNDMRIMVLETGLFTYPDVSVVCEEPRFADDSFDNLLNPTVVIEVLSHSTEEYDRDGKFEHYRRIAELQNYLLVSQYTPHVELRSLRADKSWDVFLYRDLDEVIPLDSIGCTLKLEEIYHKVSFRPNR